MSLLQKQTRDWIICQIAKNYCCHMKSRWGTRKVSLKNADSQRKSSWLLQQPDRTMYEYKCEICVLLSLKCLMFQFFTRAKKVLLMGSFGPPDSIFSVDKYIFSTVIRAKRVSTFESRPKSTVAKCTDQDWSQYHLGKGNKPGGSGELEKDHNSFLHLMPKAITAPRQRLWSSCYIQPPVIGPAPHT